MASLRPIIGFRDSGDHLFTYFFPDKAPGINERSMATLLRNIERWKIRNQPLIIRAAHPSDYVVQIRLFGSEDTEQLRGLYLPRGHQFVITSARRGFNIPTARVEKA